jgi:hypothetical protein
MRFEVMRLDDTTGAALDSTVVDAAAVEQAVRRAAETGQRLYIRPAPR